MRFHVRDAHTTASRAILAYLIGFTTVLLCVSRTTWRHILQLRHQRRADTKNILILGPNHLGNILRRLEVLPGLTGLWQVRARQDPSFDRYVALDLTYVEIGPCGWT